MDLSLTKAISQCRPQLQSSTMAASISFLWQLRLMHAVSVQTATTIVPRSGNLRLFDSGGLCESKDSVLAGNVMTGGC